MVVSNFILVLKQQHVSSGCDPFSASLGWATPAAGSHLREAPHKTCPQGPWVSQWQTASTLVPEVLLKKTRQRENALLGKWGGCFFVVLTWRNEAFHAGGTGLAYSQAVRWNWFARLWVATMGLTSPLGGLTVRVKATWTWWHCVKFRYALGITRRGCPSELRLASHKTSTATWIKIINPSTAKLRAHYHWSQLCVAQCCGICQSRCVELLLGSIQISAQALHSARPSRSQTDFHGVWALREEVAFSCLLLFRRRKALQGGPRQPRIYLYIICIYIYIYYI